ncbi:MAG: hypothetical protein WD691_01760 [Acidimicrobiales bacterium]
MSLLWAVPPVAMAVAVAITIALLRDITNETGAIADQLRRLEDVRVAVAGVRADAAQTRASLHALRAR